MSVSRGREPERDEEMEGSWGIDMDMDRERKRDEGRPMRCWVHFVPGQRGDE